MEVLEDVTMKKNKGIILMDKLINIMVWITIVLLFIYFWEIPIGLENINRIAGIIFLNVLFYKYYKYKLYNK